MSKSIPFIWDARERKSTLLQRLHGVEVDPDVPYVRSSGVIEEHLELRGTGIGQFLCVGGSRGERRNGSMFFLTRTL